MHFEISHCKRILFQAWQKEAKVKQKQKKSKEKAPFVSRQLLAHQTFIERFQTGLSACGYTAPPEPSEKLLLLTSATPSICSLHARHCLASPSLHAQTEEEDKWRKGGAKRLEEMENFTLRRLEQGRARIRSVPIAVSPEGFWCCPSPAAIQRTLKNQDLQDSKQRSQLPPVDKRQSSTSLRSRLIAEDQRCLSSAIATPISSKGTERPPKQKAEVPRKISVGFGQMETSDLKIMLHAKCGTSVRMSVHRNVLAEHSKFFADKLSEQSPLPQIEILECDDVEIYVETVGLMYTKDAKHRLIKQSVPRVLRILKIAETLGFHACIKSCLDHLEAVPWEGEEEEKVVSAIRHLQDDGYGISPILNRVASGFCHPPNDTLSEIMELVLESSEDRGRREMKSLVLKLLKENLLMANGSADISVESLYASCRRCLESLLDLFRHASELAFADLSLENREPVVCRISLAADNLLWLVEILVDRHASDEFACLWASQNELAELHSRVPIASRHLVSCITSRLFVGIGKGEMLPSKETRKRLLHVWLQPLIDDYGWLQHGRRGFDREVVEEGIGRTILTLPLEEQKSILLSWVGTFLKSGDSCPNLQRAFEVWWRRTFIRPYVDRHGSMLHSADRAT
ncbi:hypothetical protein ZIOFF_074073 [Zingiber officinale]|uniref:BTB domain-containing protein n=2 Tax=Zingiber officinale TaxID=94328 RepID=A0A8J5BZK0_ZINOF|nr:hypothetical protein ZIOFF_074073 [Zingiber officinale]